MHTLHLHEINTGSIGDWSNTSATCASRTLVCEELHTFIMASAIPVEIQTHCSALRVVVVREWKVQQHIIWTRCA